MPRDAQAVGMCVLDAVARGARNPGEIVEATGFTRKRVDYAICNLRRDGRIVREDGRFILKKSACLLADCWWGVAHEVEVRGAVR